MANWLKECQVTTVAMESTGVYWIPVFQILEAHGFDVVLVNARHVHSPGRKSDVADSESPALCGFAAGTRSAVRVGDNLIKTASRSGQKAFDQMNVHQAHALRPDRSPAAITDRHPGR